MSHDSKNERVEPTEVDFDQPPLVETATSVLFSPLATLGNPMLAMLWNEQFSHSYPILEDAEPIEPQVERFGAGPPPRAQLMFRFGRLPPIRWQMVTKDRHWMVQVQNGRLVFNWRKLDTHEYPRWRETLPRFQDAYRKLKRFIGDRELGTLDPVQWEVTYANHFVRGQEWHDPRDWPELVPGLLGHPTPADGLSLESAACTVHLEIKPQRGRLHVELEHGISRSGDDNEQILVLQLTARGPVDKGTDEGLFAGLDTGRLAIVDTFARFTGETAHKRWGKRNAG